MNIVVKSHVLESALDKASRTVGSGGQDNPLLESFNIHAEEGEVRILSTDLEVGTISTINLVDVVEPGAICVPAKKFIQVVKAVPTDELRMRVDGDHLVMESGKSHWNLRIMDAKGYPEVPKIDLASASEVSREEFLSCIDQVRRAVSQDPARTPLRMIVVREGRMMSSDGQRLHLVKGYGVLKELEGLQLPVDAVNDLVQLLKRIEVDSIYIEQRDRHILFQIGLDEFSTARLSGEFPNVDSMILNKTDGKSMMSMNIDRSELYLSLNRVAVTAPTSLRAIKMVVNPDDQSVEFSSVDSEGNQSYDEVAAAIVCNEEITAHFNIDNFIDLVESLPMGVVELKMFEDKRNASPIRVDSDHFTGVIMQVKFSKE